MDSTNTGSTHGESADRDSTIRTKSSAAGKGAAVWVAAGMLLSKISGLIGSRMFAHYLGLSDAADAFRAAFRIPNFLENLFGEGVLSASFIPVYARLRAQGSDEEASELAKAIFALLLACSSAPVLLGILATPWLIDDIAPGFHGEKRELTIRLVRVALTVVLGYVFAIPLPALLGIDRRWGVAGLTLRLD